MEMTMIIDTFWVLLAAILVMERSLFTMWKML